MSRRRKGKDVHGIVLLDKPAGFSSNQAVQKVRWLLDARKAGHTGSLDPFATGMLPVCLGEASKTAAFMLDASKIYDALAVMGQATTTGDIEGEITREIPIPALTQKQIEQVLERFEGDSEQIPPMYSALKHQGQPLYRLAREGKEVPRLPRAIHIHSLRLLRWEPPFLGFRVHCSKGTYIRTLAEDIAKRLDCCAHLRALRRLSVEPFAEEGMITIEKLESLAQADRIEDILLPVDAGLTDWPRADLDDDAAVRFSHGNPVDLPAGAPGPVRVYGPESTLLGLGEVLPDRQLKIKRNMNL